MLYRCCLLAVSLACLSVSNPAQAQWGTLTGTFVMDGKAPAAAPIVITKDEEVCGKHNLVNESLVVNPDNGGIADDPKSR